MKAPFHPAANIDEVITRLEGILLETRQTPSALAYFPALYLRVTRRVKEGIQKGEFEDGPRMERLDVIFANRYLADYQAFKSSQTSTRSWDQAFQAADQPKLIVLQHLMLGMNAHINLDLGVAAQQAANDDILNLKRDFIQINAILGSLIDDTQKRLTRLFPALGLVDKLLGRKDEKLALFSLEYARDKAWLQALELVSAKSDAQQMQMIAERDKSVARFALTIATPPFRLLRFLLFFIRLCEKGSVQQRIDWLGKP